MSDPKHRIQRILTLIPYVRKNPGAKLEDLARYCGASASEILADLDRVLLCGVPPYLPDDYIGVYVDDDRVEIRFADHFRRPIRFTLEEALALLMAIESLPEGEYSEAKDSLRKRLHRLMRQSAGALVADDEQSERRLAAQPGRGPAFGVPPWRQRIKEVLDVVGPAIEGRRCVEIEYYSASSDETASRVVHPLGVVRKQGETYLVAYCERAQAVRSFRVDRLRAARALERTFEPPAGFDLSTYERQEMDFERAPAITAKIRFDVEQVRRRRWLREQTPPERIEELPDGSITISIPAKSERWLINKILEYGPEVEVIEPASIRAALCEYLKTVRDAI